DLRFAKGGDLGVGVADFAQDFVAMLANSRAAALEDQWCISEVPKGTRLFDHAVKRLRQNRDQVEIAVLGIVEESIHRVLESDGIGRNSGSIERRQQVGRLAGLGTALQMLAEQISQCCLLIRLVRRDRNPRAVGAFIDAVIRRKARLIAGEMVGVRKLAVRANEPLALGKGGEAEERSLGGVPPARGAPGVKRGHQFNEAALRGRNVHCYWTIEGRAVAFARILKLPAGNRVEDRVVT